MRAPQTSCKVLFNAASNKLYLIATVAYMIHHACLTIMTWSKGSLMIGHLCDQPAIIHTAHIA